MNGRREATEVEGRFQVVSLQQVKEMRRIAKGEKEDVGKNARQDSEDEWMDGRNKGET